MASRPGSLLFFVIVSLTSAAPSVHAQDAGLEAAGDAGVDPSAFDFELPEVAPIVVAGAPVEDPFERPAGGSVHTVTAEELARMRYDDPQSVLSQVPSVYVRQEDGYGLRPNIGLRGAAAERSRKVTLMEDGVLFAPAPYSAPAAYYFPLMARVTGVEVTLGPSGILYGPSTIGGAVNFLGRRIPDRPQAVFDLSLGSQDFARVLGAGGASNEWGGVLLEAASVSTRGFHQLDWSARDYDTGFARTELVLRGDVHGALDASTFHRLTATIGLSTERSNETYVGLTDADFRANPYRRYGASAPDQMNWERWRFQLRHDLEIGENVRLETTLYRHDFHRVWRRAAGFFADGTSFDEVFADPTGRRAVLLDTLRLTEDTPSLGQSIVIARNDRTFISQGIQSNIRIDTRTGDVEHHVRAGVRLHYDEIVRRHTEEEAQSAGGALVVPMQTPRVAANDIAATVAFAAYASYALTWNRLTVTPGIRVEAISNWLENRGRTPSSSSLWQTLLVPGLGLEYRVIREVEIFAGVHRGVSPVAPGQPSDVREESAIQWEIGTRVRASERSGFDAAFFASDYSNLTANCSFAGGCADEMADRQYNAGSAIITGVELAAVHELREGAFKFPLRASYTYTYTRLGTAFESDNPQLGSVSIGDHLPYIPEHQLSLGAGVEWDVLDVATSFTFVDAMWERAAHGAALPSDRTEAQMILDATIGVRPTPGIRLYLRGENLLAQNPIVARRPFGARTLRPISVQVGVHIDL